MGGNTPASLYLSMPRSCETCEMVNALGPPGYSLPVAHLGACNVSFSDLFAKLAYSA